MYSFLIELALVNQIIKEAIIHGADCGGSYEQNRKNLTKAVNEWLEYKNLTNDYELQDVCIEGWNVCQITKKNNYTKKEHHLESDTSLSLAIQKVEREFEAHSNFTFQQPRLTDLNAIQVACSLLQQTITESKDSELKEYAKRYLESANEKLSVMKTCSY